MSSILIHSGDKATRAQKAAELLKDHYIHQVGEEGKRIPIKEIHELLPHLHLRPPEGKKRGVLITEAQRMGPEAQNALLKTLEEPPKFLTFVLTVPHPRLLLPTVVSRCLIEEAESQRHKVESSELARKILEVEAGQRLDLFEKKISYESEAVLSFLDDLEAELGSLANLDTEFVQIIHKLWETKKLLRDPSTNVKLTVDQFLLNC